MIKVRDLAATAHRLDAFSFAEQMGPFVLMQRPETRRPGPRSKEWMTTTAKQPTMHTKPDAEPVELAELWVATLPPPQTDGSLQLVIGRSPDCDLVVEDPAVSAKHAAILWDGNVGVLRELGSTNGTFLNGIRLGSRATLRNGDELAFGDSRFVYLRSSELFAKLLKMPR